MLYCIQDTKSKKEAIFLQLRHYLASIAAFVIVGPAIYLVEKSRVANQEVLPAQDMMFKSVPHASESLRNGTIAPFAATVNTPVSPEPSVVSSDPVIVAIALAGAAAAFFAVFFGIRVFTKFRKIKK